MFCCLFDFVVFNILRSELKSRSEHSFFVLFCMPYNFFLFYFKVFERFLIITNQSVYHNDDGLSASCEFKQIDLRLSESSIICHDIISYCADSRCTFFKFRSYMCDYRQSRTELTAGVI